MNEWEDVRKKKEKQVKVVGHFCRMDLYLDSFLAQFLR